MTKTSETVETVYLNGRFLSQPTTGVQRVAAEIIHVATPGAISPDFAAVPYKRRDPDYWPRIADPWE